MLLDGQAGGPARFVLKAYICLEPLDMKYTLHITLPLNNTLSHGSGQTIQH